MVIFIVKEGIKVLWMCSAVPQLSTVDHGAVHNSVLSPATDQDILMNQIMLI